jgi:hypothetical protein
MKKIKLFTLSFLFSFTFSLVKAQEIDCGTMANLEYLKAQDPQLENKMLQNEHAQNLHFQNDDVFFF